MTNGSRVATTVVRLVSPRKPLGAVPAHPQGSDGQTTTEWLMIAGVLTAVGIFLLGVVPSTIRVYAVSLIYSVRTIAP
jgi:pheromone shutdown protein TraB